MLRKGSFLPVFVCVKLMVHTYIISFLLCREECCFG